MAVDLETVNTVLHRYIAEVKSVLPIDKVYLYGSYVKGTQSEWSDVDVCFFSESFVSRRTVDIITQLMELAWKYNPEICFEPKAFPTSEINNDNPFVKEILRTGREIKLN
jgi:predicted nucleotidyltransferase